MRSLSAFLLCTAAAVSMASPGIGYFKRTVAHVPMHVIQADVRRADVHIAVVTAAGGIGNYQSWSTMIGRSRPAAAITGTYFDTISGIPVGTIGVDGRMVHQGLIGTAFAYSPLLGASIDYARPSTTYDFKDSEAFLRAGPRLLTDGEMTLYPRDEGFKDPSVYARAKRTALAITKQGKLLLVATQKPILLREWAVALKGLGAVDAMCLDGGSSTGLYHQGKSWIVPRRSLTNIVVLYEGEERYREMLPFLNN